MGRKVYPGAHKFAEAWRQSGSDPKKLVTFYKIDLRSVYRWREQAEKELGISLEVSDPSKSRRENDDDIEKYGARRLLKYIGQMPAFSDYHRWPGERSVAHEALVYLIKKEKPTCLMHNGDLFDGAGISRHPPTEWAKVPDVADELASCQDFMGELESVAPRSCKLIWNMGNHDSRFSMRLATFAPQYIRVDGMDLPDHFPNWNCAWSTMVNGHTMFKHRFRNGVHATWNNTLHGGVNIVTAHNHRLQVTHLTDYNGPRWGVDDGTLSDFGPHIRKFIYAEDNPSNWGQGFAWLTFDDKGKLLPPEVIHVINGYAYFRGRTLPVGKGK